MEPLDLREQRPRAARAKTGGITFLPRSIDKVRATLPGGDIADFQVKGLTTVMLERLGITVDDFTAAVRAAETEDDVVAYVVDHAEPEALKSWNDFADNRKIYGGERDRAVADYPWLAEHPELVYTLDFLDYTDEHNL
jgi:hypothetical protein